MKQLKIFFRSLLLLALANLYCFPVQAQAAIEPADSFDCEALALPAAPAYWAVMTHLIRHENIFPELGRIARNVHALGEGIFVGESTPELYFSGSSKPLVLAFAVPHEFTQLAAMLSDYLHHHRSQDFIAIAMRELWESDVHLPFARALASSVQNTGWREERAREIHRP